MYIIERNAVKEGYWFIFIDRDACKIGYTAVE